VSRPSQNLEDSLERKRDQHAIYRWQLEASTDGENFLTLFSAPNSTYLGNEVQQFAVDTVRKYKQNSQTLGYLTCNYLFIQTS